MSADIVDRLLGWRDEVIGNERAWSTDDIQAVMSEAAEDIEDLRRERDDLRAQLAAERAAAANDIANKAPLPPQSCAQCGGQGFSTRVLHEDVGGRLARRFICDACGGRGIV